MAFNANLLATSPIQRIRLLAGDTSDFPVLEDNVYSYMYEVNKYNELATAIDVVETIITILVINPVDLSVGENRQKDSSLADYKRVLTQLKTKNLQDNTKTSRLPIMIKSDKVNWNELDNLFKRC